MHNAVKEVCIKHLEARGYFCFEKILKELCIASSDAIRWDYIRQFVEEECAVELIPMSKKFFTRVSEVQYDKEGKEITLRTHPNHYIAGGRGRGTEGYANAILEDGCFAIARVKRREATVLTFKQKNQSLIEKAAPKLLDDES